MPPQIQRMVVCAVEPIGPVGGVDMIVERSVITHQDERRIAHQRGDPACEIGIGGADMGIKRLHRQQIANRRELDVDDKHRGDQPPCNRHRVARKFIDIQPDKLTKTAGHDRDHEGEEEALHRPGAQMVVNLLAIIFLLPSDQQLTKCQAPSRGSMVKRSMNRT